jgi:DNA polymerase-3 subunit beta
VKFRCERDTLAEAITTAQRAVASRSGAFPVLAGLRVTVTGDELEIVGSDLELTIRAKIPAEGITDGRAVLEARLFGDIVRKLAPGSVTVDVGDDEARITSGRSTFALRVFPADDFPRLVEVEGEGINVDGAALADAMRQVVPAASSDDARPTLTGVLLASTDAGLRLVATDSYRLAKRDLPGVSMLPAGERVLVAAKGLREVQRLLDTGELTVVLGERDALFRSGNVEVTTRLIEDKFPNYEQLIPSNYPNRLTVNRSSLAAAVERVRLVGQGQGRDSAPIRMAMSADGLELSATAQDRGQANEGVDAKFEGTELTIAFNSQYLLEGIEAADSDEVVLETLDPLKPATMRIPGNEDFLYLLMPVRIA